MMSRLSGRSRHGGGGALIQIAREVVGRRRSVQGALNEVRHPAVLDALADEDFRALDTIISERITSDREFSVVLARLSHAAARAKGFDRQIVDAALRLDALLPADDPSREREKLLRDAYGAAQRAGYVRGGRQALARLGRRALDAGDDERGRILLQQQVDLGPESSDGTDEVESAMALGELLRRGGDTAGAQTLYRRAGRSAQRLDYYRGVAEALSRQIDIRRNEIDLETLATLQRQALDAAERTMDRVLQSGILLDLAETLDRLNRREEAVGFLETGLEISREMGDYTLETRCLTALTGIERRLGKLQSVATRESELWRAEERLGNRAAAADWAVQVGTSLLSLGRADQATEAFERALSLAAAVADQAIEQRALGGLGIVHTTLGHPVDALNHLMRALELARQEGDTSHEAQWLGSIGQALWKFDQPDEAIRAINQAIGAARRIDDEELQAGMLTLLGQIHGSNRQATRARDCFTRALELNRRLGRTDEEIATLSALGNLALDAGQTSQAIGLYEQALSLAASTGERAAATRLYGRLGRIAQRRGDHEAALEALGHAVGLAERLDQPALHSQALQHLATARDAAGDPQAIETYRQALALCRELDDSYGEALMRLNLGGLLSVNGQRDEGIQHLRRASSLAAELGPAGAKLRERSTSLLAATTAVATGPSSRPRSGERVEHNENERDAPLPRRDDEVYREATLPPR
jgi:tetratricopeptide (TPR) repeat protein